MADRTRTARRSSHWLSDVCSVEGCERKRRAYGLCEVHNRQRIRRGEAPPPRPARLTCQTDGCSETVNCRWLCYEHYKASLKRVRKEPRVKASHMTQDGYRLIDARDHPLVNVQGYAYEHRLVLFDKIGPGWHPCHWCAEPVTWDVRNVGEAGCLTVDHLDAQRLNNVPENLVPSCIQCNSARKTKRRKQV